MQISVHILAGESLLFSTSLLLRFVPMSTSSIVSFMKSCCIFFNSASGVFEKDKQFGHKWETDFVLLALWPPNGWPSGVLFSKFSIENRTRLGLASFSVTGVLSYLTHVEAEKPDRLGTAGLSELLKLLAATSVHSDLTDVEPAEVGRLRTADLSELLEVLRSKLVINVSKSNSSGHWVSEVFSLWRASFSFTCASKFRSQPGSLES